MNTVAAKDLSEEKKNADQTEDFNPRAYQVLLLEKAMNENTILFLPTGSGKTYVAIMLIKALAADVEKPYDEGGKRTFFMVNTVALVRQQADSIKRFTPYEVGEYSGDMNVDLWAKERWHTELVKHQILVMTSQIFLDMLSHSYINLNKTNLLIFDECHHGVNDHPMRQIMQRFENCPLNEQPRILGLSATLILGSCKVNRVAKEVENLELTFHSKVATVEWEQMKNVAVWSTNPEESIESFADPVKCETSEKAKVLIDHYQEIVSLVKWPVNRKNIPLQRGILPLYSQQKKADKTLKNLLEDLKIHIDMTGIYGGSRACLAHLINLERKRLRCEEELMESLHTSLITGVTTVYKHLNNAMKDIPDIDKIMKFSSDKVLLLIKLLLRHYEMRSEDRPFCAIVFVQRRFTAKVLYHILKTLKSADPVNYGFLNPDFIVGLNQSPMQDTRAGKLDQKHNTAVIQKFNAGQTNVVVSSDVLEEGIDVPQLSLVIKFDKPSNHSSYIQSKGRARHTKSHYIVMVAKSEQSLFYDKYCSFRTVENELKEQLVGKTDMRPTPTSEDIAEEVYNQLMAPYYAQGEPGIGASCVTMTSAVQLINRYCSMLPQDKFTTLAPGWFIDSKNNAVTIQLPMNSLCKKPITGLPNMPNKKIAKRAAALEACKQLHQMGELDEKLRPRGIDTEILEDDSLFPLWEHEKIDDEEPKPGTNKKKRSHPRWFPESLSQCSPMPGEVTYLHGISLRPSYPEPTINRKIVFYNLLKMNEGFAIMTSKRLPPVCDFSIFLNVGEVDVSIITEPLELILTAEQISQLKHFNAMLFNDVLRLEKKFLINDVANDENAYLIVPTKNGGVDWSTVIEHKEIPEIEQLTDSDRQKLTFDENLMHTVIAPWYRGAMRDQNYIVTRVCPELSPRSQFPTDEIQTYESYFAKKYFTKIYHMDQPLVEVKAISTKMQCLKPRSMNDNKTTSKRRRQEMNEDFEEHLVPELCTRFSFPGVLWLKATCLPTVLHRLKHLLLADELRQRIAKDLAIGVESLPPGVKWQPLTVDTKCTDSEPKPETLLGIMSAGIPKPIVGDSLWGDEREPVDIDRLPLEEVRLVEIQYFEKFVSKQLPPPIIVDPLPVAIVKLKTIAMLAKKVGGVGPQQCEILQALTASTANDIVNLERSETLGDSFLKFAISQYLFHKYHTVNEGRLTGIKGKLLGNRNLYYCGKEKGIASMMKVMDFSPSSDFVPPSMCVPRFINKVIEMAELSPNVLFQLSIPKEERMSGLISNETIQIIEQQLIEACEDRKSTSTMETYLGHQTVKDKTVADGVESLIGVYLKANGIRGALKLLGWLRILPADTATPELMYDLKPPSALLVPTGDVNHHLRACNTLEERIGYTFKDRSFLLQALTHPSYEANRITESYQRLEFLGDAILDFLITCHIYEECGALTPGQLTDLRSSLVNNVYFASLIVRLGIHQFLLMSSPKLLDMIDRFVRYQEERNHVVSEQVLYLVEEKETKIAECIDVPKVLGDVFESLAGAIYLDSNMSLEKVWEVFYRLMHKEIKEFTQKVPKQPVRLLYERLGQNKPLFHKTVKVPESDMVMVVLEIVISGTKSFYHGFGENKILARTAAAKMAMKEWLIN